MGSAVLTPRLVLIRRATARSIQSVPSTHSWQGPTRAVHYCAIRDFGFDPYKHTSGRWLRNDEEQVRGREIKFDFDALCKKIIQLCEGATAIKRCEKVEGGWNKVFRFVCDNGLRAVARLPTPVAGPADLITNSEVATIKYIQTKTTIPIPKILDWSDTADNDIGHEDIISEYAAGIELSKRWATMDGGQKIRCIQAIYQNMRQIAKLDFAAYGSLYFKNSQASQKGNMTIEIDEPDYCIGPNCNKRYWESDVSGIHQYQVVEPNRGPWTTFSSYCDGLIATGISHLKSPAETVERSETSKATPESFKSQVDLFQVGRKVLQMISEDARVREAAVPMLYHPDLNRRNIFVSDDDPKVVTSIIDWQSTGIEPAIERSDAVPDFAHAVPEGIEIDEDPKSIEVICRTSWHACVHGYIPKLSKAMQLDDIFYLVLVSSARTHRNGTTYFRENLRRLAKKWSDLGFHDPCPFVIPEGDALRQHEAAVEKVNNELQMAGIIFQVLLVPSDGWVPANEYEKIRDVSHDMFQEVLDDMMSGKEEGDETTVEEVESYLREIWPFDPDRSWVD